VQTPSHLDTMHVLRPLTDIDVRTCRRELSRKIQFRCGTTRSRAAAASGVLLAVNHADNGYSSGEYYYRSVGGG